ncbi:hypothetical protein PMZ80_004029 [Knufia obscura]|nr:hypothetical protein PMZ80_004029 [Knufia obscura]
MVEQALCLDSLPVARAILGDGERRTEELMLRVLDCLIVRLRKVFFECAKFLADWLDLINLIIARHVASHTSVGSTRLAKALRYGEDIAKRFPNNEIRLQLGQIRENVKALIRLGIDIEEPGDSAPDLIRVAVWFRDRNMVALLLGQGANVDVRKSPPFKDIAYRLGLRFRSHWRSSPLRLAVLKEDADMVEMLLRYNADVNFAPANFDGRLLEDLSVFCLACSHNNLSIVRKLLAAHHNVDCPVDEVGQTGLVYASTLGHEGIVLELIHCGADVNLAGVSFRRTALQAACENGHLDIITILLNHHADVSAPAASDCGVTALQAAAIRGYMKICQILIGCGARVSAPASPYKGRTAINGAAEMVG